jgi:hypothetical protein
MKDGMIVTLMAALVGTAFGGVSTPNVWGAMEHIELSFDNGSVHAHVNTSVANPVELLRFPGEQYDGAAGVLDDSYYSSQYGWVADGFINLGTDEFIWIEHISSTDGLGVYEGGMRMMREMHTYDAIQGTGGSDDAWNWGGTMVHNWYSTDALGAYEATYEVFVGDALGNAYSQYTSDTVTLNFNAVPTPGGLGTLVFGGLLATRRDRGVS